MCIAYNLISVLLALVPQLSPWFTCCCTSSDDTIKWGSMESGTTTRRIGTTENGKQ